jgi:hypothetical protein
MLNKTRLQIFVSLFAFGLLLIPALTVFSAVQTSTGSPSGCTATPPASGQPQDTNCLMMTPSSGPTAPVSEVQVDEANPQYFTYNGNTIALVGVSGEYLPHVSQPNTHTATDGIPDFIKSYCTFDNYVCYINNVKAKGLNKVRLWLALNESPGLAVGSKDPAKPKRPYPFEQPFPYPVESPATNVPVVFPGGKWDLNSWNTTYFNRLKAFIYYCQQNDIIVEITLFAPSNAFSTSPWNPANNTQGIGFTNKDYFCRFDNSTMESDLPGPGGTQSQNQKAREKQVAVMQRVAFLLDNYVNAATGDRLKNYYWELANEPDLGVTDLNTITAIINWHNFMARSLYEYEKNSLGGRHHPIAANLHTKKAIEAVKQVINPETAKPYVRVFSGHYTKIVGFDDPLTDFFTYSAIDQLRKYNVGATKFVYGFNETKLTPSPQNAEGARAEAWEFMLNEGGLFDHLGYDWDIPFPNCARQQTAQKTRTYLGSLAKFLNGNASQGIPRLALASLGKSNAASINSPPQWCSDLTPYSNGNIYWGAMHWQKNQYVLYVHHSTIESDGDHFERYNPIFANPPNSYTTSIHVNLGTVPAGSTVNFKAEWIKPDSGLPYPQPATIIPWQGGLAFPLNSPGYNYDIALRITKQ